jgi:hypothetical protein
MTTSHDRQLRHALLPDYSLKTFAFDSERGGRVPVSALPRNRGGARGDLVALPLRRVYPARSRRGYSSRLEATRQRLQQLQAETNAQSQADALAAADLAVKHAAAAEDLAGAEGLAKALEAHPLSPGVRLPRPHRVRRAGC